MLFRVAADAVLVLHLAFIVFVVAGGLLATRWRWLIAIHLPAAVWGALIEVAGWICPLTYLENTLRRLAGEAGYTDSFIEHYLVALIYPAGLTRALQFALAAFVVLLNVAIYAWLLIVRPRRQQPRPSGPRR